MTNNHPADLVEAVKAIIGGVHIHISDGRYTLAAERILDAIQAYMAQSGVTALDRAVSTTILGITEAVIPSTSLDVVYDVVAHHRTQATAAAQARIEELEKAMVTAVIPLEAMILSGTYRSMCPEMQQGVIDGVKAVRATLAKIGDV